MTRVWKGLSLTNTLAYWANSNAINNMKKWPQALDFKWGYFGPLKCILLFCIQVHFYGPGLASKEKKKKKKKLQKLDM
jgi:hypothetical protein